MPVLAIGQGMQQLKLAAGGTLYPPWAEDEAAALSHRQPRHAVLLEPGTRIEEIYGRDEIGVASLHRQAVRRVGEGLRIGGLAPDGVIEAIEAADPHWFCVGIQWHPEINGADAADVRLFDHLVAACLRSARALAVPA
jgi:putative glutamine amidotransferase